MNGLSAWRASAASTAPTQRSSANRRDVEYSTASFHARSTTTWLVTSEGTIVRKSAAEYQEAFAVGTQAADGMRLERSFASAGPSLADLDSEAVANKHAVEEIASLADLRKAPLVEEEYHGPLLMSADAAPTRCTACSPSRSQPRGRPWVLKRAPTAHLRPAITRACCPIS